MKRPIVGMKASAARRICRREKPKNRFERNTHSMPSTAKIFTVAPDGSALSHRDHRDDLWIVLDAGAHGQVGEEVVSPKPGQKLDIPRETIHKQPARTSEMPLGEFEEDIVRFKDVYGRVGPKEGTRARYAGEEAGCG